MSRWSTSPRICSSSQAISPSSSIDRSPSVEHPRRPGVHDHEPGVGAEIAGVAPAVGLGLLVDPLGEVVEQVGGVVLAPRRRRAPRSPARPRRRHARRASCCRGAGAPSRTRDRRRCGSRHQSVASISRRHCAEVFQSSRMSWSSKIIARRQRREQPAVGGVGPGQLVEVGVLLPVLQLRPGRVLGVAPGLDERAHLVGRLVGVHLVAEEQHEVGPAHLVTGVGVVVVRAVGEAGHPQRVGAQRVDAVLLVARLVVGDRGPAGAEGQPDLLVLGRASRPGTAGRASRAPATPARRRAPPCTASGARRRGPRRRPARSGGRGRRNVAHRRWSSPTPEGDAARRSRSRPRRRRSRRRRDGGAGRAPVRSCRSPNHALPGMSRCATRVTPHPNADGNASR